MLRSLQVRIVLSGVFGCLLLLTPALYSGGEQALGLVRVSHAATLGGLTIPGSEVIYDGDLLATSEGGSALVLLKAGISVRIPEKSSVRFVRKGEQVRAELISGALVAESTGNPTLSVATPHYQFASAQVGKCRYLIQLSNEQTTVAAALNGSVIVRSDTAKASYILPEGKYAAMPASAAGVPGQAAAASASPDARHAATVHQVAPGSFVQRQGQGAETALKGDDGIDVGDIVTTRENGRLQMVLSDGSQINVGSGSTVKVTTYQPVGHHTQVELNPGRLRVWQVPVGGPTSSWTLQTSTSAADLLGTEVIVEAQPDETTVYCLDGMTSVRNADSAVSGHVILHAGQFTTVKRGAAPAEPQPTNSPVLLSQMEQTEVGPPEPGGPGQVASSSGVAWHIGPLSEAEALGLIGGAAAAAAAAIIIPLAIASPSKL